MNVITEAEVSDEGFETDSCFSVITEKNKSFIHTNANFIHSIEYMLYCIILKETIHLLGKLNLTIHNEKHKKDSLIQQLS
jgi:hypothetical protein